MENFEQTRQSLYAQIRHLQDEINVKNELRNICDLYVGLLSLHHAAVNLELGYLVRPGVMALKHPVGVKVEWILSLVTSAEAYSLCTNLHESITELIDEF